MDKNQTILRNKVSLKEIAASFKNIDTTEVHGLLELLNTNPKLDIQVKVLSILAAYLMSNEADRDMVVTCNQIYDKVSAVLANCPPRKVTVALNFVSALMYADEERAHRNRPPCARHMIRASGCLATLCDLFTRCNMYLDTWRALCRCLAEACSSVEPNQSYCTHLVPMYLQCIQRCGQRNWDVFMVLQSLLQNHKRNIQLFFESNGDSLFTRDYLQHAICLELLATILQSSRQAVVRINRISITSHLQEFLRLYGPKSQIGQWATIILYYTQSQDSDKRRNVIETHEIKHPNVNVQNNKSNVTNNDTTEFFQNVMSEIVHWEPKVDFKQLQNFLADDIKIDFNANPKTPIPSCKAPIEHENNIRRHNQGMDRFLQEDLELSTQHLKPNKMNELSFSFLVNYDMHENCQKYLNKSVAHSDRSMKKPETITQKDVTTQTDTDLIKSEHGGVRSRISQELQTTINFNEFKPIFISTPKHKINKHCLRNTNMSKHSVRKSINKSTRKYPLKQRMETKRRITKQIEKHEESNMDSEINKNSSVSARFFRAMNESCTTLVKTVKNIFGSKKKQENNENIDLTRAARNVPYCNYSFTNYMRKRDALFGDISNQDFSSNTRADHFTLETSNSCHTCNDTVVLKNKLASNGYLKRTIQKLKVGINLYGCDFKRISRNMWPRDSYMTPSVLYNLYRKLIIK